MNQVFINRLIELRKHEKLSQRDFAKKIEVTQAAVSLWERGERTPDIDVLKKIADYFDVSADFLLGRKDY